MDLAWFLAWYVVGMYALFHVVTSAAVVVRIRRRRRTAGPPAGNPLVTLIRPVRGLENYLEDALRSSFLLNYRDLEILFCVEEEDDPVVPLVRRLIAEYPKVNARLLIGKDRTGGNPKVDNMAKGWRESKGEWIIMSDSNVLLEPDMIGALFAVWKPKIGLISTPVVMTAPESFPAEIEAAFANSYLARWMLFGDSIRMSIAFGKTMMWRREVLTRGGGISALAFEAADEVAAAKTIRYRLRMKQCLAQRPVSQPIGRRSFKTAWKRQVRWARLRRTGYPWIYVVEPLAWLIVPIIVGLALTAGGRAPAWLVPAFIAAAYAVEAAYTIATRLPFTRTMPLAWIARDFFIVPVTWVLGWTSTDAEWRGAKISVARPRSSATEGTSG